MDIIIKIIGTVFVLAAILYLLKPDFMKRVIEFFKQGKRIYFIGLIRFVLAIVFLLGARECHFPWVIGLFGIMFIISGLLIFVMGPEKIRSMLDWYQEQSVLVLRVLAAIALVIGAAVIYSA